MPRCLVTQLPELRALEWYLRSGLSLFFRSTSGGTYERQRSLAYDSAGNDLRRDRPDSWTVMKLKPEQHEPSYMPNEKALLRFAQVDRWLERLDGPTRTTLELYYGDPGALWARQFDNGRLIALYHLTRTGKRWVEALRNRSPLSLPDDARLANEVSAQKTTPNDLRRMRLKAVEREAKEMLREAHRAFVRVVA